MLLKHWNNSASCILRRENQCRQRLTALTLSRQSEIFYVTLVNLHIAPVLLREYAIHFFPFLNSLNNEKVL